MEFSVVICLFSFAALQVFAVQEGKLFYKEDFRYQKRNFDNELYYPAQQTKRSGGLSSKQKIEFVNAHNDLRKGVSPSAANMERLVWDKSLENLAQRWADTCVYEHPHDTDLEYKDVGQNLYFDSDKSDVSLPVKLWYDEVPDYHYDTRECNYGKICTHYTQVVWGKSNRIGCAISLCSTLNYPSASTSFNNVWYYVCQYTPGGNAFGVAPYNVGEPCTQCESGTCEDGLCSKCKIGSPGCECKLECQNCGSLTNKCKCKCPTGFDGTSCDVKCEDLSPHCNKLPGYPKQACGMADYVAEYCPLMCGACTPADEGFTCNK